MVAGSLWEVTPGVAANHEATYEAPRVVCFGVVRRLPARSQR